MYHTGHDSEVNLASTFFYSQNGKMFQNKKWGKILFVDRVQRRGFVLADTADAESDFRSTEANYEPGGSSTGKGNQRSSGRL